MGICCLCAGSKGVGSQLPQKGIWLPELKQGETAKCETATNQGDKTIKHYWYQSGQKGKPKNDAIFIYFYKPGVDYACFANTFLPSIGDKDPIDPNLTDADVSVEIDGITCSTSEHYFQSQKFTKPKTAYKELKKITNPGDLPLKAKAYVTAGKFGGQKADWHTGESIRVMLTAVRARFGQHEKLRKILLSTYPKILVEDTGKRTKDWDYTWGAGPEYSGCNRLGKILMTVRQELIDKKYYKIPEGDSVTYYNLLNGKTAWEIDPTPENTLVPTEYAQLISQGTPPTEEPEPTQTGTPPDLMRLTELLKQLAE